MTTSFRQILHASVFALMASLLGAPLQAQLDPRLQAGTTDLLDLYQQSVNVVMKPEVVSVFDFSGSMAVAMTHANYPTPNYGNNSPMKFTLSVPASGRYDVTVSLAAAKLESGVTGIGLTNGKLVRPDGSLLAYSTNGDQAINANYVTSGLPGETSAPLAADVRNWIRSASHVRFTNSGRTFDLPICWTILDAPSVQPNVAAGQFRKMYNTYPLKMTIINPGTSSNSEIEMDTAYRVMSNVAGDNWGMYSAVTLDSSSRMTACTFNGGNSNTDNFIGWEADYIKWIFQGTHSIPQATSAAGYAFANGIPGRSRTQAVKDAAMRTWAKYYNKVFWAYRFLKYFGPDVTTAQNDSASNPSNDSRHNDSTKDPLVYPVMGGSQREWVLLNSTPSDPSSSDKALNRLAALVCGGSTPLNSALANTYAQLNDPNCVFNDVETGVDKPVECRNTYVMLFTDGIPNTDAGTPENTNTPYVGLDDVGNPAYGTAKTGNAFFAANKTRIDTSNATPYYNIINLAALAAHGGDLANGGWAAPTYPATTQTYPTPGSTWKTSDWIPFWIRSRGAGAETVTFNQPRPITTMTIGVSLEGTITSSTSPKRRMFLAAAFGEPGRKTWDVSSLTAFTLVDPTDPTKGKTPNSTYFFDATDPDKLTTGLDAAFYELSLASNVNSTSNPNLPYIGASLGKQVYLGKFQPPTAGGAVWAGDLMMFGTKQVGNETQILDKDGSPTTNISPTTAVWSVADSLFNTRLWSSRKLYTRIPGTTGTPENGLSVFSDTGLPYTDASKGLKNFVAKALATDALKQSVIQFVAGGNIVGTKDGDGRPTTNRPTIMGDIINSSPAALEYKFSDVQAYLTPKLAAAVSTEAGVVNRFRLILVGTNQGWLHAFGEVSNISVVASGPNAGQEIVKGAVDELWAFLPTDFLANLNYLAVANNPHRFMVDGTPSIYFLDLPPATGGLGNGVLDIGSSPTTTKERAVAIVGLRKGGRSYYALDIHDPFNPTMKWSLVPDEADFLPTSRVATGGPDLTDVKAILKNWGFSTCTPGLGRIAYNGVLRDAVFLGGGASVPEVEAKFLDTSGNPTLLGRSVLALDVYTGEVLGAEDLSSQAGIGPISNGLIPFEFFLNSGMAQRAYFLDGKGGLWSWGRNDVSTAVPYVNYRIDSSDVTSWSIRKVYQDGGAKNSIYSTLPAPFRVGYFPGRGKDGAPPPAAVGIAIASGDRNNPLDFNYNAITRPSNHKLTVVFDRQDRKAWSGSDAPILDAELMDAYPSGSSLQAGDPLITPGNNSYYLAPHDSNGVYSTPKLGWYRKFPAVGTDLFVPKGLNSPIVVAGSLFYSYFTPMAADPCVGGSGNTYANLVCDVMNPIIVDNRTNLKCLSGNKFTWINLASEYVTIGTTGVLQGGVVLTSNPAPGESSTTISLQTITGNVQERYPKPRVWRTVR